VTGGAGFIGSNIVDKLIEHGYNTIILDNLSTGKKENINPLAKFYHLDITSSEIEKIFMEENITHVIHHAAQIDVQSSMKNPLNDMQSNIKGTINLLENCRKYNVKKIIYASSAAVYGEPNYLPIDEEHSINPMSPYGISKHTPEHYIKIYKDLYEIDYTILRYANAYGPKQDAKGEGGVVSIFVDRMIAGERPIIYGDGNQTRDFIYIEDIVEANIKALSKGDGEIVNISCNTQDSVNDLYKIVNEIIKNDIKPIYKKERKGDIRYSYLDNTKAKEILNWLPAFNFKQGITYTINYYLGLIEAAVSKE
ncbi:MAG: NAD-dependent epimerase/dehydratase family protein, partial [Halanaerobiales bacterium]